MYVLCKDVWTIQHVVSVYFSSAQNACNVATQAMSAVVAAFGTRGDVQPVLILAVQLAESSVFETVTFVTHESHCPWVQSLAANVLLKYCYVDTKPASTWNLGGEVRVSSCSLFMATPPVTTPPPHHADREEQRKLPQPSQAHRRTREGAADSAHHERRAA
jgi:hypothetical protein